MHDSFYVRLYRSLFRIRRTEEEVARVYPTDKIKSPVHLSIGQESVSVGVCETLRPDDVVFGTYRSHALYLAKGGDLKKMIAELYGKATGCARGKGGSMHLIDTAAGVMGTGAIVGTPAPHAVGYAWAMKLQGRDTVAVSMSGDAATEEGAMPESWSFAVLKKLPVLFVCENNFWAVYTPLSARQPSNSIYERARAYGIPAELVEDGDIFKIHEAAKKAVDEIRHGGGPRFLECMVYRWREHVGPNEDYNAGYRSRSEAEPWMANDQVKRVGELLPAEVREAIEEEVLAEIREAFEFAEASPFPNPEDLYTDVVAEARHGAFTNLR